MHPLLHPSFRLVDSNTLLCTSHAPGETVVQVQWKERHTNGTYSLIGVQNPNLGTHVLPPYKDMVKLNSNNLSFTLEIHEEKVVCCEMITYPQGMVQETCLTTDEDKDTQPFHLELLVTLVLGGIFVLGSFIILCHIFWTRNGEAFKSRGGGILQEWRSRETPLPYDGTRNLGYNHLSLANRPSHETLPHRNIRHHRQPSQRNQLVPEVPPRRCQRHDVLSSNNQRPSENPPALPDLPHATILFEETFGTFVAASVSETIYSKHQRKKTQVVEPSWGIEGSTSSFDINARPSWPSATSRPEEVAPLQKSISSPLSTINPMYHSRIQWMPHPTGSLRL
ncbi:uncharacterized protein LOC128490809 [Spea bombifrons]|uniref:uncharacterized protein LOC128490809 n=1 Tax=Spea bombifrons TaxID=233779 RepID=UPI00234AF05A|nr:uncharacterized protein LOC128490809 [Spea bombifrons]